MYAGKTPFVGENEYIIFENIKDCKIQPPDKMNEIEKDLIL